MAITVWCPHPGCGQEFDVRDAARGLHVPCPACHRAVPIAAPAEPPPLPDFPPPRQPLAPPVLPPTTTRRRRRRFGSGRGPLRRGSRSSGRFGRQEPKTRHGCVTAWLILIILANVAGVLLVFLAQHLLGGSVPVRVAWFLPTVAFLCVANVVCAAAVFNWKSWGVVGICLVYAAAIGISVVVGTATAMSVCVGLLAPVVLLIVLQFGDKRSTWSQLD